MAKLTEEEHYRKLLVGSARQQFIGFNHAKKGWDIKSLCVSMGLNKKEWEKIKEQGEDGLEYLDLEDCNKIDDYFEEIKSKLKEDKTLN